MSEEEALQGREMLAARMASRDSVAFGAMLLALGIFAVLAPLFTGIAVTVLVGLLLLGAGIVEIVFAFRSGSFGRGVLRFLFGGLGVLAGLACIATPGRSLGVLTVVLAGFFLAGGVVDIVLALKLRSGEGRGWMLFSGIVSIALAGLIVAQWPVSGAWAVGLTIGVRLLMHGWVLMALGRSGEQALTHLQDTRIERLEAHVRAGAQALQQTQTALAEHTAMLLALDNELRKKVSTSEVDPAIRELNQDLGQARAQMQEVASAARESWDKAQRESNETFGKLQSSIAEITRSLKQSLGLEEDHGGQPSTGKTSS